MFYVLRVYPNIGELLSYDRANARKILEQS